MAHRVPAAEGSTGCGVHIHEHMHVASYVGSAAGSAALHTQIISEVYPVAASSVDSEALHIERQKQSA